MQGGGRRKMLAILAVVLGMLVTGAIALQIAIWTNGPAVLDTVDRLMGGKVGTERIGSLSYGDHPQQRLFIHRVPHFETNEMRPVIAFIHGGSWRDGDPDYYDFIGRSLAAQGFLVVNLGYRLGDDGRWPAMLEDGAAGIAWVRANIADYGGDPDRIVLMGHSAGAYNAAMLALDARWLEAQGVPPRAIAGFVGLAGPYDFYPFDSDSTRAAFGGAPEPEATQPVNHVQESAPPMLLIHGLEDTTVKPRNSQALARIISEKGGEATLREYPGMDHSDPLVALAAPWRNRGEILPGVLEFARAVTSSVPVQAETR